MDVVGREDEGMREGQEARGVGDVYGREVCRCSSVRVVGVVVWDGHVRGAV